MYLSLCNASGAKLLLTMEFRTLFPHWHAEERARERWIWAELYTPRAGGKTIPLPHGSSAEAGEQSRGCLSSLILPQQNPSAKLLLYLSPVSTFKPCHGPFWRLVEWGWGARECRAWEGSGPPWHTSSLSGCQDYQVFPWLSPKGSCQHMMPTQSFLHHCRDPLSLVLKNNSC